MEPVWSSGGGEGADDPFVEYAVTLVELPDHSAGFTKSADGDRSLPVWVWVRGADLMGAEARVEVYVSRDVEETVAPTSDDVDEPNPDNVVVDAAVGGLGGLATDALGLDQARGFGGAVELDVPAVQELEPGERLHLTVIPRVLGTGYKAAPARPLHFSVEIVDGLLEVVREMPQDFAGTDSQGDGDNTISGQTVPANEALAAPSQTEVLVSVKLCVKHNVTYTDSGNGEDYWTTSSYARPWSGGKAKVKAGVVTVFDGYLSDGIGESDFGCTDTFLVNTTKTMTLTYETEGRSNGHEIFVGDQSDNTTSHSIDYGPYTTAGTYTKTGTNTDERFPVYRVASRVAYRHNGGVNSNEDFLFRVYNVSSAFRPTSTPVHARVDEDQSDLKFLIAHEYGHYLAWHGGVDYWEGIDYGAAQVDSDCDTSASHGILSHEYSLAAASEGWGTFIAADAFNNHGSGEDCTIEYWGSAASTVDCEGDTTHDQPWMEEQCNLDDWPGYGNEHDWTRVFWDVHTNSSGTSMSDMVDWVATPSSINKCDQYEELDDAANSIGGGLNSLWDTNKATNGVDHICNGCSECP